MYELIKIENTTIGSETVPTVNARELHEFLESKQQFSDWIKKRLEKYDFIENYIPKTLPDALEAYALELRKQKRLSLKRTFTMLL